MDIEAFEERAAIMEYDGRLTRSMAERLARICQRVDVAEPLKPLPPEKRSKHYTEFHDFWRSRQIR